MRLLLAGAVAFLARPAPSAQASAVLQDDITPIYAIQGGGLHTPLSRQRVSTIGLVSGVQSDGFYLQDANGDGKAETSDGIFVYTSTAPRVEAGACILVRGAEVTEYYEKTELTTPRALETLPVEVCGGGSLAATPAPLPAPNVDPASLLERFEGMLVAFAELQGVVQGPTKRFSSGKVEMALVADRSLPFVDGGRVFQSNRDDAAGLVYLGNGLGAVVPEVGWGDRVRIRGAQPGAPVLAVVDYSFGKYLLLPLPGQEIEALSRRAFQGQAPEAAPLRDAGAFRVCSFNVLGLGTGLDQLPGATEYEEGLRLRARAIAAGLQNCEIIGLQETGKPQDAENLARVLSDVSGQAYSAIAFGGPGTVSPDFPLTNSLLVRDDRVSLVKAQNEQACTRFSFSVRLVLGQCPARLLPLFSRPPLVADLLVRGDWEEEYALTVVVNHWRSKRGDESVNVVHRRLQAEHVASIVQSRLEADTDAHVVVLGDLNDFEESEPVAALQHGTEPAMVHPFSLLPRQDRYTYIFDGASQALDHLLVTRGMLADFGGVDIVHINADFPIVQSGGAAGDLESAGEIAPLYGSSDHDPLVLTVRPGGSGWISGNLGFPNVGVDLVDSGGGVAARTKSDGLGEFRFFDLRPGAYSLQYVAPAHVTLATQEVRVAAGQATVVEASVGDRRADAVVGSALFGAYVGWATGSSFAGAYGVDSSER